MAFQQYAAPAAAATYGLAIGANMLILPLFATKVGYTAAEVGYLTAVSAGMQLVARLILTATLRLIPNRLLVTGSSIMLAVSFGAVSVSHAPTAFTVAMACQGISRAGFWTGIQTHAVQNSAPVSQSLAKILLMADVGRLGGPILAGYIVEASASRALYLGAAIATVAVGLSLGMKRLPTFDGDAKRVGNTSWFRPPIIAGCLGVSASGSWRILLGSYIPVVLAQSQQSGGTIGILLALANAASIIAAAKLAKAAPRSPSLIAAGCCLGGGLSIALIGVSAPWQSAAAACVLVGGYCAGALQILGTTLVTEAVSFETRGHAIALSGTVRATTMLILPLIVATLLQTVVLAIALAMIGTAHGLLGIVFRRLRD